MTNAQKIARETTIIASYQRDIDAAQREVDRLVRGQKLAERRRARLQRARRTP